MKKLVILALLLVVPSLAMAKPDGPTAKKVLDYYLNGSEVVLLDYQFCSGIKDTECIDPVDPKTLASGASAYLWMNFMVPKPVKSTLFIQFKRKGAPCSPAKSPCRTASVTAPGFPCRPTRRVTGASSSKKRRLRATKASLSSLTPSSKLNFPGQPGRFSKRHVAYATCRLLFVRTLLYDSACCVKHFSKPKM